MGTTSTHKPYNVSPVDYLKANEYSDCDIVASGVTSGYVYFALRIYPVPSKQKAYDYLKEVYVPNSDGSIVYAEVIKIDNNKDYYNFSYKEMNETCGPYDNGECPTKVLNALSPLNISSKYQNCVEWAQNWRNRQILKKQAKRNALKLVEGMMVKLPNPVNFGGIPIDSFRVSTQYNGGKRLKTYFYNEKVGLCRLSKRHQETLTKA